MRFVLFLMLAALSTAVCAEPKRAPQDQNCRPILNKPISLYETFDNEGINIGITGDVLYMVYQSPVLTYASLQTVSSQVLTSHILNVPGHLSVGCNIALSYTMPNQPGYSFESSWYHIVAKFSRSVTAGNLVPAHAATLTLSAPGTGKVDGHTAINFWDLLIKKDFSLGDWFFVSPAAGLIGGFMNGKSNATFVASSGAFSAATGGNTATTNATLYYTNKYEGIGMKIGALSSFKIWKGLKLKTDFFYSVLYGFAHNTLNYSQNGLSLSGTVRGSQVNYTQHQARAFFDSLLGLAWGQSFRNDSLFVDLHAGWRFQTFADGAEQFEAEFNDSLHTLSYSGQGLQAGATFKF